MTYTLISFHWKPNDSMAGGSEVQRAVDDNRGSRVEIDKGVYLYRTAEDALCIHRLSEALRLRSRNFLVLRFEAETCELSGGFPEDLAKQLKASMGIEVGNLKEPKP
jgi:hypothetical protein